MPDSDNRHPGGDDFEVIPIDARGRKTELPRLRTGDERATTALLITTRGIR